ncbi:hypothetical protein BH23VER1_BH23VER1_35520 [soil metagenome]
MSLLTPYHYHRAPLLIARLAFALAAWFSFPGMTTFVDQPSPTGLAQYFDFTWLAGREPILFGVTAFELTRLVLAAACIVYALGFADLLTLPVILFATVSIGTLNNSQGAITHHLQIVPLVALGQWIFAGFWAVRFRGLRACALAPSWDSTWLARDRWFLFVGQQMVVATYLVTALTKLRVSGLGWIADARYFPLQLLKSERMDYYNTVSAQGSPPEAGFADALAARIAHAFAEFPDLARAGLSMGLFLELSAFLALLGPRWSVCMGGALILFHLTISRVMNLNFTFNVALLAGFFVVPPLVAGITAWSRHRTRRHRRAAA